MAKHDTTAVVAIVGGDHVVGRTLEQLLRSTRYTAKFFAEPRRLSENLPAEYGLLLLAPGLEAEVRESLYKSSSKPVLELVTTFEEAIEVENAVLWPCRMEELQRRVKAALDHDAGSGSADGSLLPNGWGRR